MSLHFPFPSVFKYPDSSDLNADHVYQVKVVDKDNTTLTESPLFYLKPGMPPPASTPSILDSGSAKKQGLSTGASAGLAVGLFIVVVLLALGGWALRRFLKHRSDVKRRASIRSSIRHLVPVVDQQQSVAMNVAELHKIPDRPLPLQTVASPTCVRPGPGHDVAPPPRPPRSSSSTYSLDHALDPTVLSV